MALRDDDTDDGNEESGEGVTTDDCAGRRCWGDDGEYSLDDGETYLLTVGVRLLSDIVRSMQTRGMSGRSAKGVTRVLMLRMDRSWRCWVTGSGTG